MPNWCNNSLVIKGKKADLKIFEKAAYKKVVKNNKVEEETELSFENFIPIPEEQKENWYDFCVNNWGTKWDACEVSLCKGKKQLVYTFDTAWGPPAQVITAMAEQFTELKFRLDYEEPGMAFCGFVAYEDGVMTDDIHRDMTSDELENGVEW